MKKKTYSKNPLWDLYLSLEDVEDIDTLLQRFSEYLSYQFNIPLKNVKIYRNDWQKDIDIPVNTVDVQIQGDVIKLKLLLYLEQIINIDGEVILKKRYDVEKVEKIKRFLIQTLLILKTYIEKLYYKEYIQSMSIMFKVQKALAIPLDEMLFLSYLLDELISVTNSEVGTLVVLSQTWQPYDYVELGIPKELIVTVKKSNIPLLELIKERKFLIFNSKEIQEELEFPNTIKKGNIFSLLAYCFQYHNTPTAVLLLANKKGEDSYIEYSLKDIQLLDNISLQIASIIENFKLYKEISFISEFNKTILQNIATGIVVTNLKGEIVFYNNSISRFLERENLTLDFIYSIIDKYIKQKEEGKSGEEVVVQRDEKIYVFNVKGTLMEDVENRYKIGFIWVIDEITEKKLLEEKMKETEKLTALGELSAGIAHELKNPLTSIKGFIELLENRKNDGEFLEKFISITKKEVDRLLNLTQKILNFVKPRIGEKVPFDLLETLNNAIDIIAYQFKKSNIELVINNLLGDERLIVEGFPEGLIEVFVNLLMNAIQAIEENRNKGHIKEGRIEVIINKVNISGKLHYLVDIKDNGVGIKEELIPQIFNPFFTTKPQGTGLGLSVSQKIISEMGGFIQVDSKLYEGSTFRVILPAKGEPKFTLKKQEYFSS